MAARASDLAFTAHDLRHGWHFRSSDAAAAIGTQWLECSIPTNVHLDLIRHGKIPDPYVGFNEIDVEWINSASWTYRTRLPDPGRLAPGVRAVLAFDGLDTFATAKLNGAVVLESDNMFVAHRVDVSPLLKSCDNVLEICFDSAWLRGKQIQEEHPIHKYVCFNGDSSRLCVRKAQYHYGWDWGPFLMTAGPWLPVRLEVYRYRVSDVWADIAVKADLSSATVVMHASFESIQGLQSKFKVALDGKVVAEEVVPIIDAGQTSAEFIVKSPALWYPHGYGKQPLYELTVTLMNDHVPVHKMSKKFGVRRVELVQQRDKHGKSFFFRINGIDVFCGGSDWIPADMFLPHISEARYRRWLELMVDGNQNMVRVWGGGVFEADCFYDICDELGILVWQDFLFGCGNYPAFPAFLESVEAECETQLKRIRHHPSIVILAGNNEDYQVQESFGLTYDYSDKNPLNWLKTDFPARYIYEKLLPDVVERLCPSVAYHPGSPWGDGKLSADPTVGDRHTWDVWHGAQEKYQIFDSLGGRFMSEFGMEAFPHLDTIKWFVEDERELYPQSQTLDFHNKAEGHERRLATYVVENMRQRTDLEGYIHLTQLVQSEALMFAYRGWRREWGDGRKCGGALCWQLNDCYPVTSWSICDYFLRKKPAYYSMARVLRPLAIGVRREHHDWSVVHARPAKTSAYEMWVVSSKTEVVEATVELRFISIKTGREIRERVLRQRVAITPNGTTDILQGVIDNKTEEPHVLAARLFVGEQVVARDMDWPQPLKYLSFEERGVEVDFDGESSIRIRTAKPVKGLVFEEREGVLISDSALDVAPGDEQVVRLRNFRKGDKPLGWRYLDCPW